MSNPTRSAWVAFALAAAALPLRAATNYWDNNGATPGFGAAGGTWGAEPKWSADRSGGAAPGITATTTADDLHFGTASNGLAAGIVTVDGNGQGFRSLTFGIASGAIALSGGTLNLAAPVAAVFANNPSNTIGSALTGAAALTTFGPLAHTSFLTTNATTLFPGSSLAAYRGIDGVIGGAFVGGGGAALPGEAYFFVNDGTNATCQLQILNGAWTKCVKVALAQSGPDIQARIVYAKYINNGQQLGYDFDAGGNVQLVATSHAAAGYGVAETTLTTAARYAAFLPPSPASTTIVHNASLAGFVGAKGLMGGTAITGVAAPAQAYFFTNDGSTATYQLQADNGGFTKCVKVELTQVGADIAARALYAKYTATGNLGYDFDTGGTPNSIATSFAMPGYGAATTVLDARDANSVLTLTGTNTYTGSTTIGGGPLVIGGAGQLGSGSYTGAICNSAGFLYHSAAQQTLGGPVSGAGALVKGRAAAYSTLTHSSFLTSGAATLFTGAALADYVGADGVMGGAWVNGGAPAPAQPYYFSNDGATCAFQLQTLGGGFTKCVKVELTQVGADLAGRVLYAKYVSGSQLGYNFDTGGNVGTIATSYAADGYGAAEVSLTTYYTSTLTLSAANTYSGGTDVNAGTLAATTTASALPPSGAITVANAGELWLAVASGMSFDNAGGVGNGNPLTVNSGGTLTLAAPFNAGYSRLITLDGGRLDTTAGTITNGENYVNNLALRNGARVTGNPTRIGYHSAATITVAGTNACVYAAGILLVNNAGRPLTFDVQDVTGAPSADLTVSGSIGNLAGYPGMPIVKTGAGTLVFSGANTFIGTTTVNAGMLALGANNTLDTDNPIVLNGGTLAPGAFTNTVGTLTLAADSQITLGAGPLAFADCRASAWTGSLTLTGTLGPRTLRFGSDANALTSDQLQRIRNHGQRLGLDENGYLQNTSGTVIFVR